MLLLPTEKPLALMSDEALQDVHEGHCQMLSAAHYAPAGTDIEALAFDYAMSLAEIARRDALQQARMMSLPL